MAVLTIRFANISLERESGVSRLGQRGVSRALYRRERDQPFDNPHRFQQAEAKLVKLVGSVRHSCEA